MIWPLVSHWQSYAGFILGAVATGGGAVLVRWYREARQKAGV